MEQYGDLFPGDPEDLGELLEQLAQRMAAASAMLASMTPGERAQLQELMDELLSDMDLSWQVNRLAGNLRAAFPAEQWGRGTPFGGGEGMGLAVVRDPDLVRHQRFEVGEQVGLTTLLELALAFPAQDQQGLGQLLQIRPDGAVARWSGAFWLQIPQIAQQGLVHQPNRQPLTQVLVFQKCADSGMGFEKPRLSLIRTNSVDQTRIAELAVLSVPVPESSGTDVVLIGEEAGKRVHASHRDSAGGTK